MDIHAHYCRQCRTPWEHDGDKMTSNPQIRAEHKCPRCGTPGWVKFYGNETHDEMCQLEALLELSEDDRVPEHVRAQAERDFVRIARRVHPRETPPDTFEAPGSLDELLDLLRGLGR